MNTEGEVIGRGRIGGWAPGGYLCTCKRCSDQHTAAKGSTECEACARAGAQRIYMWQRHADNRIIVKREGMIAEGPFEGWDEAVRYVTAHYEGSLLFRSRPPEGESEPETPIQRTKRLWERWNKGDGIPDDRDFNFLVGQYEKFRDLFVIFNPRPEVERELSHLQSTQAFRRRR